MTTLTAGKGILCSGNVQIDERFIKSDLANVLVFGCVDFISISVPDVSKTVMFRFLS
jgi:hypothetical protein